MASAESLLTREMGSVVPVKTQAVYLAAVVLALFEAVLPRIADIRLVDFVLVLLTCYVALAERHIRLPGGAVVPLIVLAFPGLLLLMGLAGQLVFSLSPDHFLWAYAPAVRVLIYSLFFWLGYHIFSGSPGTFRTAVWVMMAVVVVHGCYGFVQFVAIHLGHPDVESLPYVPTYVSVAGGTRLVDYAPAGFTGAVFTLASLGLIGIAIGFSRFLADYGNRLLAAALTAFSFLVVLSTGRRSQLIAAVLMCLVMVAVAPVRVRQRVTARVGAIVAIGLLLMTPFLFVEAIESVSPSVANRLRSVPAVLGSVVGIGHEGETVRNWAARIGGTWERYWNLAKEYPLGTGLYPPHLFEAGSDNAYLTHLVWGGPLLLLMYLLLYLCPLVRAWRELRLGGTMADHVKMVPLLAIGVLVAGLWTSMLGGGVFSVPTRAPFWIVLAGLLAHSRRMMASRCREQQRCLR